MLTMLGSAAVASATEPQPPTDTSVGAASEFDVPGGVAPEVLQEGTWFDDQGRLYFPENSDQSAEKDAAFCSFVFGTPEEVAAVLGLDGELAIAENSGLVNLGGGGIGYSCGYVPADSEDALEIATDSTGPGPGAESEPATTGDAPDTTSDPSDTTSDAADDDIRPLVVFALLSEPLDIDGIPEGYAELFQVEGADSEYSGALGLSTEYDGDPIDEAIAQAWLTTARDRLA